MVLVAVLGAMCVWPTIHLSLPSALKPTGNPSRNKPSSEHALRQVLSDWLVLVVIFQLVIWPIWFSAGRFDPAVQTRVMRWSAEQVAYISVGFVAWTAMAGLVVGWSRWIDSTWSRMLGVATCLLLVLFEPIWELAVQWLFGQHGTMKPYRVSPLSTFWALTEPRWEFERPWPWIARILSVFIASLVGWMVLLGLKTMSRKRELVTQSSSLI